MQFARLHQFIFRTVALRITAIMPMDSGATSLDDAVTAAGSRASDCPRRGIVHRKEISAVHLHRGHAEASRPVCEVLRSHGILNRGSFPVAIVFDDEDGRQL